MQMESHVHLNRQFSPLSKSQEDAESDEIQTAWGYIEPKTWENLLCEFRSVILAEAGAGKTEELRHQANLLADQGKHSFFIRIEDIESDFYRAFEIGEETQFQTWLKSIEEAWFFLDSVDEARLDNPRTFEKALRCFAKGIRDGAHRAHIYLSSRPYSWRPKGDKDFLDEVLYLPAPEKEDGEETQDKPPSALTIYAMRPLDIQRIREFSVAHSTEGVDQLIKEIERTNLWSLAERPFDLEGILAKWAEDKRLGGRLELLRHNIDKRLQDDHNIDRSQRQPLNLEYAREGARRLAAAVVLSGQAGIYVPDGSHARLGLDAESVLSDWSPQDVRALLERGIFNGVIYGMVRFRHREVRELLAAEWFDKLLKAGTRLSVEALFFREQYGEKIITPRLRPILPWLILFDNEVLHKVLELQPEIAVESGDPSQLPLFVRQRILKDIVHRIVSDEDDRSARDNSAIARIANSDLAADTLLLINQYTNSDDAIFFLGRLVWQGEMENCIPLLAAVAVDNSRGIYARIASARAVMTCGTEVQIKSLWQQFNKSGEQIPREILAELVQNAAPHSDSVNQLLISLSKLPPYERYKGTGLSNSIHEFVKRMPITGDQLVITRLVDGFHNYLQMQPYTEQGDCHVSEEYAWLLSPATHAVERLIEVQSTVALGATSLSIMLMVPTLRYWRNGDFGEHKSNLQSLVPNWPALNDALYWASIAQARIKKASKSNELLIDDWPAYCLGHFWKFNTENLPRLLGYMRTRSLQDDRLVALSTAFRVYIQTDKPENILGSLRTTVTDDAIMKQQLEVLLNPPVLEDMKRYQEEMAEYQLVQKEEEEHRKQARDAWIAELRANPNQVCNPPNLPKGEFINNQLWLLNEIQDRSLKMNHLGALNWQVLIPDFGDAVAKAFRDAAINHWRYYTPTLQSEGVIRDNSIPPSLIFAMAGLEMEATEFADFPHYLKGEEVNHALRYITRELNGFPSWFERIHQAFPALVEVAVIKELLWELDSNSLDVPKHYILHDLVYYAPWLHSKLAPVIFEWAKANPMCIKPNRHYCLRILVNGGIESKQLASLAKEQVAQSSDTENIAWWSALRVDCDPGNAIPEFEQWLMALNNDDAKHAAQVFITMLLGGSHMGEDGPYIGHFRTAEHLKSLYVLMSNYIRTSEDIHRANGGVYSPTQRDDAQNARDRLFTLLAEIPGKACFIALKQLAHEHPDSSQRSWMAKRAYKRAEDDGDLDVWTASQIYDFDKSQHITPKTHRQLFELTVHRLLDLKNWLERGNDSPWETWQRAQRETEMRNLIAGWLNSQCRGQYTTAQEPELANSQRIDIWLHNTDVHSPVPIELKLLDKVWTGPKLCERLRNQLVGDYLREQSAGCGVMLLVSQRIKSEKRWRVNGKNVELSELAKALKSYWQDIAAEYSGVDAIEVIVIDLTRRCMVSNS